MQWDYCLKLQKTEPIRTGDSQIVSEQYTIPVLDEHMLQHKHLVFKPFHQAYPRAKIENTLQYQLQDPKTHKPKTKAL